MKRFFILIALLLTISGWLGAQNYYKGVLVKYSPSFRPQTGFS